MKNKLKDLQLAISYLFRSNFYGKQIDLLNWVKNEIGNLLDEYNSNLTRHSYGITTIKVNQKKDLIIVSITTTRPGTLIGKYGCLLDTLIQALENRLIPHFDDNLTKIKIEVEESDLWMWKRT